MNRFIAAAALLSLGLMSAAPAYAGEANNEPFNNNRATLSTTYAAPAYNASVPADVGSAQFPDTAGRPGTVLTRLDNTVLPVNGSEGAVETANSLPRGFETGTVAYAQAQSVQNWMIAHSGVGTIRTAGR